MTTRGLEAGTLKLAGIEEKSIYELATEFLTNRAAYENMAKAVNPYGDGNASRRICEAIRYYFQQTNDRPVEYKPQI
ncbi:UDP-N-acetylglucosamine 2-epimerase [Cytobacillus firmus]|uniref:UDP-N-acetylglucosamine 2-epimerase n=1 Tax=Cytobacillus firmus TaxID=1399 RepID=UPI0039B6EE70